MQENCVLLAIAEIRRRRAAIIWRAKIQEIVTQLVGYAKPV
jgi:hypothetical protein